MLEMRKNSQNQFLATQKNAQKSHKNSFVSIQTQSAATEIEGEF